MHNHPFFVSWVKQIDFRVCVKNIVNPRLAENDNKGMFLSNRKTFPDYKVDKINYFIDAPIELHIIDIIWTTTAGQVLDNTLDANSFGNRLGEKMGQFRNDFYHNRDKELKKHHQLFKRYVGQYNAWRDQAI